MASTIPCQAVEWRYFSRAACYTIMGLPFSLDIIQHGILRGILLPLPPSLFFLVCLIPSSPSGNRAWPLFAHRPLADGDPRLQWVILATNPIVHFALSTHSESSPYLRIFEVTSQPPPQKRQTRTCFIFTRYFQTHRPRHWIISSLQQQRTFCPQPCRC